MVDRHLLGGRTRRLLESTIHFGLPRFAKRAHVPTEKNSLKENRQKETPFPAKNKVVQTRNPKIRFAADVNEITEEIPVIESDGAQGIGIIAVGIISELHAPVGFSCPQVALPESESLSSEKRGQKGTQTPVDLFCSQSQSHYSASLSEPG